MTQPDVLRAIEAELRRIGLDPDESPGLAMDADSVEAFLRRLRELQPGSSWSDVFPDQPKGWHPGDPEPEQALGAFDYPDPPRGIAVYASLEKVDSAEQVAQDIFAAIDELGVPQYGRGLVLDWGHPHLYVILPLGATEEDADALADLLSRQPGVKNSYPILRDG